MKPFWKYSRIVNIFVGVPVLIVGAIYHEAMLMGAGSFFLCMAVWVLPGMQKIWEMPSEDDEE